MAGSIRRGKAEVGDIELIAIPRVVQAVQRDLFGGAATVQTRDLLADLEELRVARELEAGRKPDRYQIQHVAAMVRRLPDAVPKKSSTGTPDEE